MNVFSYFEFDNYEYLFFFCDFEIGLKVIVVIYNIFCGLVFGGCWMYFYVIDEEVFWDVL